VIGVAERAASAGASYAAVQCGVRALDASLGGIGGCPFAPNAIGNIPTEDLAYLLAHGHRHRSPPGGPHRERAWIEAQLGKAVPGLLAKAGLFPGDRVRG
jgi:hydroxymethylglutaryl-CoA lyase